MDEEQTGRGMIIADGKGTVELADGIIHLVWNASVSIDVRDADSAMTAVNTLAGNDKYPMLVDMATTESVTRAARTVFSAPCAANRIALLGSSPVDRVIANFFVSLNTLPCPTRFFTSRAESLSWLLKASEDQDA